MSGAGPEPLDDLIDRLERTAAQLRDGELAPARAAALVEECARLATEAASVLDRRVRAGDAVTPPGAHGQLALD